MTSTLLTVIGKDGRVAKDKDPNLSTEELLRLYRTMLAARIMDERGLALQRQGRIGFYLQALGQEASDSQERRRSRARKEGVNRRNTRSRRAPTRWDESACAGSRCAAPRAALMNEQMVDQGCELGGRRACCAGCAAIEGWLAKD